jgi:hypothetical protein
MLLKPPILVACFCLIWASVALGSPIAEASDCDGDFVEVIDVCPPLMGDGGYVDNAYGPPNVSPATDTPSHCVYKGSAGMWGVGVRCGFYMQAFSNLFALSVAVDGATIIRVATAILSISFLSGFVLGINRSALALEAPVSCALISIVTLPLLVQSVLCWSWKEKIVSQLAMFVICVTYIGVMMSSLLGSVYEWDHVPPECNVVSGLSGESALSTVGRRTWLMLFALGMLTGYAIMILTAWKICIREGNVQPKRAWLYENRRTYMVWIAFSLILYTVCITSVEMTMKIHRVQSPGLGFNLTTVDQWIPFSVGILSIILTFIRVMVKGQSHEGQGSYEMVPSNRDQQAGPVLQLIDGTGRDSADIVAPDERQTNDRADSLAPEIDSNSINELSSNEPDNFEVSLVNP